MAIIRKLQLTSSHQIRYIPKGSASEFHNLENFSGYELTYKPTGEKLPVLSDSNNETYWVELPINTSETGKTKMVCEGQNLTGLLLELDELEQFLIVPTNTM